LALASVALTSVALGADLVAAAPAVAQEHNHEPADQSQAAHVHAEHSGMPQPRTPIPALTDADRLAARPPAMAHGAGDDPVHSYTLVNRLETWDASDGTGLGWEAGGWIGGDINRLWWRSEGERADGRTEAADVELLFGHSFAPRWDWLAGVRQDLQPSAARSFVAVGVRGLAPQWFEVAATAYVGEGGRTAARLSIEYSLLFTNRLVLQPLMELNLYGKDDESRGIGSGLSTGELGLRLRYEITRRCAPYLGATWDRAFGTTADLRRGQDGQASDLRLVAGIRLWF
jgi:copper resistance protein B